MSAPLVEETVEQAAAREREVDRACERLHAMGAEVKTVRQMEADERDWQAEDELQHWVGLYMRNIAEHYHEILRSPHTGPLEGILEGAPVLIAGAGPSLDASLAAAVAFPGLIVATDRAAKALAAAGRHPDLVVAVDPRPHHIAAMLRYPKPADATLIASVCLDPEAVKAWGAKVRYTGLAHPGTQFFDRILPELFPGLPTLPLLGNVGNAGVALAAGMGAGQIVLAGMDYGYTDGKWGCLVKEFTTEWVTVEQDHDAMLARRTGKLEVPGLDGRPVTTYAPYLTYRDALYRLVKQWKLDVVNATGAGILTDLPRADLAALVGTLRQKYSAEASRARLNAVGG